MEMDEGTEEAREATRRAFVHASRRTLRHALWMSSTIMLLHTRTALFFGSLPFALGPAVLIHVRTGRTDLYGIALAVHLTVHMGCIRYLWQDGRELDKERRRAGAAKDELRRMLLAARRRGNAIAPVTPPDSAARP